MILPGERLFLRSFPPSPSTCQLLIKHVALLLQTGPEASGVIYKQTTVTSQVSGNISDVTGLWLRKRKIKVRNCWHGNCILALSFPILCIYTDHSLLLAVSDVSSVRSLEVWSSVCNGIRRKTLQDLGQQHTLHRGLPHLQKQTKQHPTLGLYYAVWVPCTTDTHSLPVCWKVTCMQVSGRWRHFSWAYASPCTWFPSSRRFPPFPLMAPHQRESSGPTDNSTVWGQERGHLVSTATLQVTDWWTRSTRLNGFSGTFHEVGWLHLRY